MLACRCVQVTGVESAKFGGDRGVEGVGGGVDAGEDDRLLC